MAAKPHANGDTSGTHGGFRLGAGRPKDNSLPTDWQDTVLACYAQGGTDTEVRAKLGMGRARWYRMLDEVADFREVVEAGRDMAKAWLLERGRKNLNNPKFNARLYELLAHNRLGWGKRGLRHDEDDSLADLSDEELERRRQALQEKLPHDPPDGRAAIA